MQTRSAHTALRRAEGWAGSAAPCPCPCPRAQPEPPLGPGLSGRRGRNLPASGAPHSSEMLPGSSPREHWLLLPLVSVPEIIHNRIALQRAKLAAPLDLAAVTFFRKAPSVSLVAGRTLGFFFPFFHGHSGSGTLCLALPERLAVWRGTAPRNVCV